MAKVIVAGTLCLDITPIFADRSSSLAGRLEPGKLIQMEGAAIHPGGCVSNTGLGMKKLGADARLVGKIGTDAFGRMLRDLLHEYGADGDLLEDSGAATSYSIVLAPPGVDRTFLHHPGVTDTFRAEDISDEMLEGAALPHFGYPSIMQEFYRDDGAELVLLLQRAHAAGCATSLDMAMIDEDSPAGRSNWTAILANALPYVDFFLPSIEELGFLLDRPLYESWQARAQGGDITKIIDLDTDVIPLSERCLELGAKVVLIKCGVPGMYWQTAGADVFSTISPRLELDVDGWADRQGFETSYVVDEVRSGTGAGDTSIAAFLTAMLEGSPIEECVRLASATGACCVEAYDALSGLMSFPELRQRIAAGWKKYGE